MQCATFHSITWVHSELLSGCIQQTIANINPHFPNAHSTKQNLTQRIYSFFVFSNKYFFSERDRRISNFLKKKLHLNERESVHRFESIDIFFAGFFSFSIIFHEIFTEYSLFIFTFDWFSSIPILHLFFDILMRKKNIAYNISSF